jgi:hypothetical protein
VRVWQDGVYCTQKVKYPVQVLYDAAIRHFLAKLTDESLSMVFKGSAAGTTASFCLTRVPQTTSSPVLLRC